MIQFVFAIFWKLYNAEDTAVEETEEIDRCVQQSFATNTIVAQVPNADLLCTSQGVYSPVGRQ